MGRMSDSAPMSTSPTIASAPLRVLLAVAAALIIGAAAFAMISSTENDLTTSDPSVLNTPKVPTQFDSAPDITELSSACPEGDADCHKLKPGSYCKYYQADVNLGSTAGRLCHGTDKPCSCTRKEKGLKVGDKVDAKWTNGRFYKGKVATVNADGTYNIDFDDGDKRPNVKLEDIKPVEGLKVGDKVDAKWTNGRFYKGKVATVNADGT